MTIRMHSATFQTSKVVAMGVALSWGLASPSADAAEPNAAAPEVGEAKGVAPKATTSKATDAKVADAKAADSKGGEAKATDSKAASTKADEPSNPPAANCPPGFFCADAPPPVPLTKPSDESAAGSAPASSPASPTAPNSRREPRPEPPVVMAMPPTGPIPPYTYFPRPEGFYRHREWGLNLHINAILMGPRASDNAGMGGLGLGLRYRHGALGFEGAFDLVAGRDFNGWARTEGGLTGSMLLVFNPQSRVQGYGRAGMSFTVADVADDYRAYSQYIERYSYVGGLLGGGVEFRASRDFGANIEVRGLLRTRTDDRRSSSPEFRSSDGQTSNTSIGAILQGGLTFYF